MKVQVLLPSTVMIALMSLPAWGASRSVTIHDLAISNGRLSAQVPAGDGVVMDLSEVGQIVKGVLFGDATKFVITGVDGQLCYMQQGKCEATGASVVSFRQVKGVEIPTQSHSPDGSTTVTLITEGKLGRKVLHLRLLPAVKAPYTAIVVRANPTPVLLEPAGNTLTQPRMFINHTSTVFPRQQLQTKPIEVSLATKPNILPVNRPSLRLSRRMMQRTDADALAMGLSVANPSRNNNIKIEPRSAKYNKVQSAIAALRRGGTREEAAKVSGLKPEFIDNLIDLGRGKGL